MKKLKKKGRAEKTKAGELVLINEKGQTFRADKLAVLIWDKCDGKVISEDLAKEISQKTLRKESVEAIERIVRTMENVGLIESVE